MKKKLFRLKTKISGSVCNAVRCERDASNHLPGDLWDRTAVHLCVDHTDEAIAWADAHPPQPHVPAEEIERIAAEDATKALGLQTFSGFRAWLAKLSVALRDLGEQGKDGETVLAEAKLLETRTHSDLEAIAGYTQEIVTTSANMAALEKALTQPLSTAMQRIRERFKAARQPWADAEEILRAKFTAAKIMEAKRNAEAMQEAASAAQKGEDVGEAILKIAHTSDVKGMSATLKWVAKVKDINLIPETFVIRMPNTKLLAEHASKFKPDETPTAVPGVVFELEGSTRVQKLKE